MNLEPCSVKYEHRTVVISLKCFIMKEIEDSHTLGGSGEVDRGEDRGDGENVTLL